MRVYVTQYALTKGIQEHYVEVTNEFPNIAIVAKNRIQMFHKPYWHENYQDAVKHAEEIKTKKIKSLQKQMEKINALKF